MEGKIIRMPISVPISLIGFWDNESAQKMGKALEEAIFGIAGELDLSRLDGVTVAYDYDSALASIDRGRPDLGELTRSLDEKMIGIAMAPLVWRDGEVRAHVVFHAEVLEPLLSEDDAELLRGLYVVYHEFAHVHDLAVTDKNLPGTLLEHEYNGIHRWLMPIVEMCWKEYLATKLGAKFMPDMVYEYERVMLDAYDSATSAIESCVSDYLLGGCSEVDNTDLLDKSVAYYGSFMVYAGYLLGHLDGLGVEVSELELNIAQRIEDEEFYNIIKEMRSALRELSSDYGHWCSLDVFFGLERVFQNILRHAGVVLREHGDELFIEVN